MMPRPEGAILRGYGGIEGEVRRTRGLVVQFWYKGDLFATRDVFIFRSRDQGMTWEKVAMLAPAREGLCGVTRYWLVRFLKSLNWLGSPGGGYNLRVLQDGTILAGSGVMYRGRIQEGRITTLNIAYRGPTWLSQGWTEDHAGGVYFGEYQCRKHVVTKLWCSRDQGQTWKILHNLPSTEIRHIHCVAYDPYRHLLWVTTGDDDHESRIFYSHDQGVTLQELGGGSQEWTAVSLQFTPKAIYWGMDGQYIRRKKENLLFKWNWHTGHREVLVTSLNPFYYSAHNGKGDLFFSTAVEENPELTSRFSELLMLRDDNVTCLAKWPKGNLNSFGVFKFAQGDPPPGWVAFTPINLRGHHLETLVMNID